MKKLIFLCSIFFTTPVFAALNIGDLMTISNDSRFQSRCNYYVNLAAINVMSESAGTTAHAQRVAFSKLIIGSSINLKYLASEVLTNATIAGEATLSGPDFSIPDSDISFTVNSLFNALAGVSN